MRIDQGKRVGIFIPTLNAESEIDRIVTEIKKSSVPLANLYIIDSNSTDDTVAILGKDNIMFKVIQRENFSHGHVRNEAAEHFRNKVDYLVMLTQDVIFTAQAIDQLILGIVNNPRVGISYGQQRSTKLKTVEYYDRVFSYPDHSQLKSKADIPKLGASTYFSSDAFSIYRLDALFDVGNFPVDINFAEDVYVAGKMILKEWDIFYNARAKVIHNNVSDYKDLFRRYKHISRFYHEQAWLSENFGGNSDKGRRLVVFEIKEAFRKHSITLLYDVIVSSLIKLLAYFL